MSAKEGKTGGGQGRVRSSFGHGRMVKCSGEAPGGKPCQRARFQARGVDVPYDCGEHRADVGKPGRREQRVSTRRKMPRRWERRK